MKRFVDWKIRNKLIAANAVLLVIPLLFLVYLSTSQFTLPLKTGAEKELENVVNTIYALCEISSASDVGRSSIPTDSLAKIRSVVKEIKIGETGYPYVIDVSGELIIHPTKEGENILWSKDSKGNYFIKDLIQKAVSLGGGKVGEIRYPWINVELGETSPRMKMAMFHYLPRLDWVIVSGSYEDEIYQVVSRARKTVIMLSLSSLLILSIVMVLLARAFTRPILDLTNLSSRMAQGEYSIRVNISQGDEIGKLARSFNRMGAQIQEHTKNLEGIVALRTQELSESKERYKEISTLLTNILESSTEYAIIATDLEWRILEFNTGARKILGWTKEEIKGLHIHKTYANEKEFLIGEYEYQKLKKGQFLENELMRQKKNGEVFLSRAVTTAIRDDEGRLIGFLEIARDITERKRLEWELKETKDYLENILESSVDGIITTDIKGIMTYINRGMEEILKAKKEEYIGTHVSHLYADGIAEARKIMSILRRDQKFTSYEMALVDGGGREIPINTSASLLKDFKGETIGTVGIFKDLTEKKKLQADLHKAEASLIQAAKMRELGDLVSGVAHEINNPLMASQTILYRLKQNVENDEDSANRKLIDLIERCNMRIATIVNHLREFSRETEIRFEPLDVRTPLSNALLITGQQLLDHNIQLTKDISPDLPVLLGSAPQLEQVFLNIISNARDALDKQESDRELIIRAFSRIKDELPGEVTISFTDTGPGIPPEIMYRIFDPFFSTKEVGRGTGLGLSICYGIVEKHGGRIEVDSDIGKGATFRVILPTISH